jgi:hypothetical protein
VRCGERIVLKIQISHTVQGSNGDKEVTETGTNTALQRPHRVTISTQLSMHKTKNIENKGTAETKMGRDPPPPLDEHLCTYWYNFTLKMRVYLLILERDRWQNEAG